MTKRDKIKELLFNLYCPRDKTESMSRLREFIEAHELRSLNANDRQKSRLEILVIETKGNGKWQSFAGWGVKYVDVNHVSDIYAEVYIYDLDGQGLPSKIRIDNPKYSIIY